MLERKQGISSHKGIVGAWWTLEVLQGFLLKSNGVPFLR